MNSIITSLVQLIPALVAIVLSIGVIALVNLLLSRRWHSRPNLKFRLQFILLALVLIAILSVILTLPVSDSLRGQLLSLIGILLSAAIALSSTTFIGNILAGIMLRIIKSARMGDFITVTDITGRISEMGLLHTEVQTEDRDLVTIPNVYMVTQPMKVVRTSGTIVSAEVSLGYDVSRIDIYDRLQHAAEKAGLINTFVQVRELGDFSVLYRVAGLKEEVKGLISARSKLREEILDSLHEAGIEIVSPNFMNTRVLPEGVAIIPKPTIITQTVEAPQQEDVAFDKAEEAETIEELRDLLIKSDEEISLLEHSETPVDEKKITQLKSKNKRLEAKISKLESAL